MASARTSPPAQQPQHGVDRLSQLPGDVLGHVLSFLSTKEAARAAALARRYRHAFAGVDAVSFVEQVAHYGGEDYTFCLEATERRSKNGDLIDDVNSALLCRRRCAGSAAPPRVFRVHFGCLDGWDEAMLGQWLSYLLKRGTTQQELHLDLRLQLTVLGEHYVGGQEEWGYGGPDGAGGECPARSRYEAHRYTLPTRLFSCLALRTLCLGGCDLDPPQRIDLPHLETLLLSSIPWVGSIQRLVSACPRLVDLTLERCGYTPASRYRYGNCRAFDVDYTIAALDKHLRRLAIRCCHNLVSLSMDASELRAFEYRGAVPTESFLTLHGARNIVSSCTIGICGKMVYEAELPRFRKFLEQFAGTKKLQLISTHLGADIAESEAFSTGFPLFPTLRHLRLTGYLHKGSSIEALTRILEQAPSIEILTLFMKPSSQKSYHSSGWEQWHELGNEYGVSDVPIPCLRDRLREINLVHYQGDEAQRYAAKLLLCNAMVLERVCVVFPRGPRELQMKLTKEIKGWLVNSSTETIFL